MSEQKKEEYDGPWIEKTIEWKRSDKELHTVALYGSWNKFKGDGELDYQGMDLFSIKCKLPLGTYLYRFLIDNKDWTINNNAPTTVRMDIKYNKINVTQEYNDDINNNDEKKGSDIYVLRAQLKLQQQHNAEIQRVKTLWHQERDLRTKMHTKVVNRLKEAQEKLKDQSLEIERLTV